MMEEKSTRESGAEPITKCPVGAKLVRLMAEGLLGVCDQAGIPYPRSMEEFENSLVNISRETGFQAGLSFKHKPSHRQFYELLGMDGNHAGRPYPELFQLAENDESIKRGLILVSAFATTDDPGTREEMLARSVKVFREFGGEDFELIARAFEKGDCQRDLVFEEMQVILRERGSGASQDSSAM